MVGGRRTVAEVPGTARGRLRAGFGVRVLCATPRRPCLRGRARRPRRPDEAAPAPPADANGGEGAIRLSK